MDADLLITKGLSTAIILGFFALIVLFLRRLYGPGGWFRDPKWDRWNAEALLERLRGMESPEDKALEQAFHAYAEGFLTGDAAHDGNLRLKNDHSMRVLDHARELAATEPDFAKPEHARALRLAALFHDVGRFEQYNRYHTFADDLSCNHGLLGARILRAQGFLDKEAPDLQKLVLTAVAAHNRFAVPRVLSGTARSVLLGLRDADKLDILRVMAEHLEPGGKGDSVVLLHLADQPEAYSPAVLSALQEKRTALYKDMRYTNDFRLLLCTWLYDFNYPASLAIVKREGYYGHIVQGLEQAPEAQKVATAAVCEHLGRSALRKGASRHNR